MVRERIATAAVAGSVLVAGVVAWRLAGASVQRDVAAICGAESRSGWTLRREMPALTEWIRGHLTTPEGNTIFASLGDVGAAERGSRLRAEAAARGIEACPLAAAYDGLAADADARAELQRVCSYVTFPDLSALDDAARLDALEAWIERDASTPRTRALAGLLRDASTPADRAAVLRAAATALDVFTCDVAGVLERPPPAPDAGGPDAGGN
jgi:hypothetical protein